LRGKIETLIDEFRRRLLTPDFDGFEAHYGCSVPSELRQFYDLKERLLAGVLYATHARNTGTVRYALIQYAEPMDRANWADRNWADRYGREFFRFATDVDGYGLLSNPVLAQSPVLADWGDGRLDRDIEALDFTLADIVATLGSDP
jgi:hypothetical protein